MMNGAIRNATIALSGAFLAGCTTVPDITFLHADDVPQVGSIIDEIACEIYTSDDRAELKRQKYLITVLLTLQVDDQVDLTPSLSWVNPIRSTYSFLALASGDIGGQRERTFTTTYNMDALQLMSGRKDCSAAQKKKFYNLSGDLGVNNIIADGMQVFDKSDGIRENPSSDGDKTAPSFGSKVQFIVTKSVTALGPTWTLKYFKGPSGSNGLLSGKRLDTDSVLITFTPQLQPNAGSTDPANVKAVEDAKKKLKDDIVAQRNHQGPPKTKPEADTQKELDLITQKIESDKNDLSNVIGEKQRAGSDSRITISQSAAAENNYLLLQQMLLSNLNTAPH